jgi:hypothetical protein
MAWSTRGEHTRTMFILNFLSKSDSAAVELQPQPQPGPTANSQDINKNCPYGITSVNKSVESVNPYVL